jgi:NADH dehydrogenase
LASKGQAQEHVARSGLDWTAFRPSVIFGPEDEFANAFARLVPLSPLVYPIIDRKASFQPVWVEDVATSLIKAVDDPKTIGREYDLGGPEVLTLEEIERRTLQAVGARRLMVPLPKPLIRLVVTLMETLLPAPPVTRSLLELLAVSNVTERNSIHQFVADPKAFTPDLVGSYMHRFTVRQTLSQFFGG